MEKTAGFKNSWSQIGLFFSPKIKIPKLDDIFWSPQLKLTSLVLLRILELNPNFCTQQYCPISAWFVVFFYLHVRPLTLFYKEKKLQQCILLKEKLSMQTFQLSKS